METKKVPDILYHYTTMDVLFSIINNVKHENPKGTEKDDASLYKLTLWATHAGFMNDPVEFSYLTQCINKALERYEKEKKISKECTKREKILSILNRHDNIYTLPAILSLSEAMDNLPMWRCYSNNAQGVAIGFSSDVLSGNIKPEHRSLFKCSYLPEKDVIEDINIDELYNSCTIYNEYSYGGIPVSLTDSLYSKNGQIKHPAYYYENEWRLIFDIQPNEYKYRMRNGVIIPYCEVEIPANAIKEIWIGPTAKEKLALASLTMLLENKIRLLCTGKDVIYMRESSIPYSLL